MHTKERRARAAKVRWAKGDLVEVNRDAVRESMGRRAMSIQSLAKASTASAPEEAATAAAESMRKRLASVLGGRQRRMRRAELRAVARTLKVKLDVLIVGGRGELRHPAEVEAARVRQHLADKIPANLVHQIDSGLEKLLTFDTWHQALGLSEMAASSRRLAGLQERFARHLAEAILCLLSPLERGGREWNKSLLGILVNRILSARERQLDVVHRRRLVDLSGVSRREHAVKNHRKIRKNLPVVWEG